MERSEGLFLLILGRQKVNVLVACVTNFVTSLMMSTIVEADDVHITTEMEEDFIRYEIFRRIFLILKEIFRMKVNFKILMIEKVWLKIEINQITHTLLE